MRNHDFSEKSHDFSEKSHDFNENAVISDFSAMFGLGIVSRNLVCTEKSLRKSLLLAK